MDIAAWLKELGLEQYEANFREHAIDETVLRRLTSDDLHEAGVRAIGHRRKLLDAIAALPDAPAGAWGTGRRQLTVLCCDLVDSTALAEQLDPEDMGEVIREVLGAISTVVGRFSGYVAKFTGDGALVYFGYPHAHEDDAERAARAALGIVEAVSAIGGRRALALNIRIGIATGAVVVGELLGQGAAQERSVVGGTPAMAARLQVVAKPGQVAIAANTRQLLGDLFVFEPLGTHALKGFNQPVEVCAIVRERPHVNRFEAVRAGPGTPLVGRDRELAVLLDGWRRASRGEGQAVVLVGEAGIGKSRTAQAIRDSIEGERHLVVRYQCSPHHANEPFYPVIGQLWHGAEFVSGESGSARLDKIESLVDRSGLQRSDSVPYLAHLLSVPTEDRYPRLEAPPSLIKERTIEILISMLRGIAKTTPVLFLFEDFHWIDPTTLDLVNRAIDALRTMNVLCVVTARPDFVAAWSGRPHVTVLTLTRLERHEAEAMIRFVCAHKPLPPELVEQILTKTDGIPLFVEELTKTVLGSGLVRDEQESYQLIGPLMPLAIPSTLQDSLMARLDSLAPVKEVAQIGAVIGREFSFRLIEAVSRVPSPVLRGALRQLVEAELIYPLGSAAGEGYVFKHALVQDTAYASLLRTQRHRIHAEIARALTNEFAGDIGAAPEIIAHHYTEAGLPEPAARHWLTAAERALARSANLEGARYAEKGLALLAQIAETPERRELELGLQLAKGNALLAVRGYTARETVEVLTDVKRMLDSGLGTDMHRFSVLYGLWAARYVGGQIEAAHELAREYLSVASRQEDATFWMIGHRIFGAGLIATGQHNAGLLSLKTAEQHYDPVRHKPLSYRFGQDIGLSVLCHEVWALWFLGRLGAAAELSRRILLELPDHGHATTTAFCTLYGGVIPAMYARAFDDAARLADDLVEYCTRLKMGPHYVTAGRIFGNLGRGLRDPSPSTIDTIRADLAALHDSFGVYVLDSPIIATLAEVQLAHGDVGAAEATVEAAIVSLDRCGERFLLAEFHRLKGVIALAAGKDPAVAVDCFTEAMSIAERQETPPLQLRAATDLARLERATGRCGGAESKMPALLAAIEGGEASVDVRNARSLLNEASAAAIAPAEPAGRKSALT